VSGDQLNARREAGRCDELRVGHVLLRLSCPRRLVEGLYKSVVVTRFNKSVYRWMKFHKPHAVTNILLAGQSNGVREVVGFNVFQNR
jgi:hypothetical protein